jgi:hypothetical protein
MEKWGLIIKAAGITGVLLVVRLVFDYLNLDVLSVTSLITAFIGAAIFTIAIIFAGTLTDYKESEKIPSDIATIRSFYSDLDLVRVPDKTHIRRMKEKTAALMRCINKNFRHNMWNMNEMDEAIDALNADISRLVDMSVPPNYVIKLKTELTNIDRISHRVKTIAETSFIPAAYAISELAAAGVIILLFFVKLDPFYEGLVLFFVISMLLIALLLLIKDMDNPFEVGKKTYADIDLFLLWDLEENLNEKTGHQKELI